MTSCLVAPLVKGFALSLGMSGGGGLYFNPGSFYFLVSHLGLPHA